MRQHIPTPHHFSIIHITLLCVALIVFSALCLFDGAVKIPANAVWDILSGEQDSSANNAWRYIILYSRLPSLLTAIITGAALSVCGLLMQSYFRNPLAGPSILGITSGAHLGVSIVTLYIGGASLGHGLTTTGAAVIGAITMLLLLLSVGRKVSAVTLLIVGMLCGYLTGAVVTLLNYHATAENAHSLIVWGMGDFTNVSLKELPLYSSLLGVCIVATITLIKPLNAWMLGESYARNLGINLRQTRMLLIAITGVIAAITTAYCGPISFIGLATPHIARMMARTDNHRHLLPLTAMLGAIVATACLWATTFPGDGRLLPLNALTPVVGIPIILYVVLKGRNRM